MSCPKPARQEKFKDAGIFCVRVPKWQFLHKYVKKSAYVDSSPERIPCLALSVAFLGDYGNLETSMLSEKQRRV